MFAATKKGGMANITAPDVCKTTVGPAVVPIPYPNIAQLPMAVPTATKVFIDGALALTKESKIPSSNGDEAGASGGGGVVSAKVMGPTQFVMSSQKVKIEGKPAVRLNDLCKLNDGNTVGMHAAPSQLKVMIMS